MRRVRALLITLLSVLGTGTDAAAAEEPGDSRSTSRLATVREILEAAPGRSASAFGLSVWDDIALSAYAEEISESLGEQAGAALASLLAALPERERSWTVARWALSAHVPLRRALIRAAAHPLQAVGLGTALAQLALDPDAEVRSASRRALAARALPVPVPVVRYRLS